MKAILRKLKEPYPESSSFKAFFWEALGVGSFIFFFLYFFRPFGISQVPEDPLALCIGFGLITFAASLLFELVFRYALKIRKDLPSWTLGKWILTTSILIAVIALANHAYLIYYFPEGPFHVRNLFFTFITTFSVGIFPIIFGGLYNQVRNSNRNVQQAGEIILPADEVESVEKISLISANKNQSFEVASDKLLYLEAMQNYVIVYYVGENKLEKEILRSSLSQVEEGLPSDDFFRCHRSYIVNLSQISRVEGNAQGLKLFLQADLAESVPVARKKIKELKSRLSQKSAIRP